MASKSSSAFARTPATLAYTAWDLAQATGGRFILGLGTQVKAHIDVDKCIGCAECMAFCRFGAVDCNLGKETAVLQESIAEHALGVLTGKQNKAVFFNFLLSVTKDCDCFDVMNMPEMVGDLGIIASTNPVAVDKAALDMIEKQTGKKLQSLLAHSEIDPLCQIRHAENIGLGSMDYEFIEID